MAVSNRKVLQLAGSTLENIKALAGEDAIQGRELLVATDTKQLILGNADGSYTVIGSAGVGTTSEREAALPQKGQKD